MSTGRGAAFRANRKRKLAPTMQLSSKLEAEVPESDLYTQLLDYERTIDATVLRKRYELEESVKPTKAMKTLRLWVYSTTQQAQGSSSATLPVQTLRIVGKLQNAEGHATPKFTSFLKSACVNFVATAQMSWSSGIDR